VNHRIPLVILRKKNWSATITIDPTGTFKYNGQSIESKVDHTFADTPPNAYEPIVTGYRPAGQIPDDGSDVFFIMIDPEPSARGLTYSTGKGKITILHDDHVTITINYDDPIMEKIIGSSPQQECIIQSITKQAAAAAAAAPAAILATVKAMKDRYKYISTGLRDLPIGVGEIKTHMGGDNYAFIIDQYIS
jgi:hypothetical protein